MADVEPYKYNQVSAKQQDLQNTSLSYWLNLYFNVHVIGSSKRTIEAKQRDLTKFQNFFIKNIKNDLVDYWTPSVSKLFQNYLIDVPYSAATINRIFATLRNAANFINKQRPFLAGHPLSNCKDIAIEEPAWRGLTSNEIARLKIGCEHRIMICTRSNQNPYLEAAVFHVLLNTGLREHELVALNIEQYHSRGFHNVKRKGKKITKKVFVPSEAREYLDKYLATRKELLPNDPLFVSRYGNRLNTRDVDRICERIAKQASSQLPENEKIYITPHMLRHTFLKKVADNEGVHIAQSLSGNISMREIFRYTKPSEEEMEEITEKLSIKY